MPALLQRTGAVHNQPLGAAFKQTRKRQQTQRAEMSATGDDGQLSWPDAFESAAAAAALLSLRGLTNAQIRMQERDPHRFVRAVVAVLLLLLGFTRGCG